MCAGVCAGAGGCVGGTEKPAGGWQQPPCQLHLVLSEIGNSGLGGLILVLRRQKNKEPKSPSLEEALSKNKYWNDSKPPTNFPPT